MRAIRLVVWYDTAIDLGGDNDTIDADINFLIEEAVNSALIDMEVDLNLPEGSIEWRFNEPAETESINEIVPHIALDAACNT